MTLETLILAAVIAAGLYVVRTHAALIRAVWQEARWWERALLAVALLPIPGPVDEILGVLVIRRIVRRRG